MVAIIFALISFDAHGMVQDVARRSKRPFLACASKSSMQTSTGQDSR
jgi:hypothetical protein